MYYPNGISGLHLEAECSQCPLGDGPCHVYALQMQFNYKQCGNDDLREAMDLLIDEEGCQVRRQFLPHLKAANDS